MRLLLWKVRCHTHLLFQSNLWFSNKIRMDPLRIGVQNSSRVSLVWHTSPCLYRNSGVHYVTNNLTALHHGELAAKIGWLMRTTCMALLSWHQHYTKIDFAKLGRGPTIVRQVWVAHMEMAISVAKVAKGNFCTQESLHLLHTKMVLPVIQKCSPTPPANIPPTDDFSPFNHLSHLLTPMSSYQIPW